MVYQIKIDILIAVNHNTLLLFRSTHVTCFGRSENLQATNQPYTPSLNKIPAKTIALWTGASKISPRKLQRNQKYTYPNQKSQNRANIK
jgi:hypothetical protein